ncbi:unnamed protein product [Ixodes persulcatus]
MLYINSMGWVTVRQKRPNNLKRPKTWSAAVFKLGRGVDEALEWCRVSPVHGRLLKSEVRLACGVEEMSKPPQAVCCRYDRRLHLLCTKHQNGGPHKTIVECRADTPSLVFLDPFPKVRTL